ncbi:beta-ketoacyl synthase N-terminal-like domain-containing protein, partial [Chromobacterium sphagni]|uniref:beta-ketoacyl synthase N-terminal-like domain-containing protein n=1 Tax=Chromobacterium sphagni TaxID=1903179 RepID=UPI000ACE6759
MERLSVFASQPPASQPALANSDFTALLLDTLWRQLETMGFELGADGWRARAQTLPLYSRWLGESARMLRASGYPSAKACDSLDALWRRWETLGRSGFFAQAGLARQAELVEGTLRALPDILSGRQRVTDLLFPNASMAKVEGIYKANAQADYFNNVVAGGIGAIIRARQAQGEPFRLRILEIGGGTGGTSEVVFDTLRPFQDCVEAYVYTDISKAFLLHAEDVYGPGRPYLRYQLLDIQQPVREQGLAIGDFDVVIAANVLHATRNIRTTLRNAKALLKRNGVLLVNEIVENNLFAHLTFGLTEGWWLVEDAELRIEGCPALSVDGWSALLREEGFDRVRWPAAEARRLGQQVFMARSDGQIRQPAHVGADPAPAAASAPAPEAAPTPDDELSESIRGAIAEQLRVNLRLSAGQIHYSAPFGDYGVDSITGVKLVHQLNETLGISLETSHLYDYSTIRSLAEHIRLSWGERVGARLATKRGGAAAGGPAVAATGPALPPQAEPAPASPAWQPYQPIAVIGVSGTFAGAADLEQLWSHLANGDDLVRPSTRWPLAQAAEGSAAGRYGGFLADIDRFDPLFFNISATEAKTMDPQQRLFLEEAWKALEDAGYAGDGVDASRCGVYVGYNGADYQSLVDDGAPAQAMWGNAGSILSARISYCLNLQGPAITVDTACSSSLVAVHLACQGLWSRETDLALAGGAFVQSTPGFYSLAGRAGMLSPSGRCHTFDARADGFVPGEGVGVVVLKRLRDAVDDGDHVHGVIRGSGINQDGTTNGITAPSALSQERLQRQVYQTFGIDPAGIQLVEAHGTGTRLGDPVELRALTNAFGRASAARSYCAIGSIKTNLGHTAAAAGIAGLIKLLLALRHRQIPPSLHYDSPNPAIDFDGSPFYVNTALKSWEVPAGQARRAAVSAFGFSGTNAHVVVEEHLGARREHAERPGYLLALSGRTPEQLRQQARRLADFIRARPDTDLGNLCFTLLLGRKHLQHRLACAATSLEDLLTSLEQWLAGSGAGGVVVGQFLDGESREKASLKHYGRQCVQALVNGGLVADDYLEQLRAVGALLVDGYAIDYAALFAGGQYGRLPLPTYPFADERYWIHPAGPGGGLAPKRGSSGAAGPDAAAWLARQAWQSRQAPAGAGGQGTGRHLLWLLGDFPPAALHALRERAPHMVADLVDIAGDALAQRFEAAACAVLARIRRVLESRPSQPVRIQLLINAASVGPGFGGLGAMLKTASRENPLLAAQTIELCEPNQTAGLAQMVLDNAADFGAAEIRYRGGERQVKLLERVMALGGADRAATPWRDGGVYLITGGLGGLGYLFASAIAGGARQPTLLLVNRSALTAEAERRVDALRRLGARVDFQQADVAEAAAVRRLIEHAERAHGGLH